MSKNVGIVTFHESENYGTVLQAFALQESIKALGYNSEIINYQRDSELIVKKVNFIERVIRGIVAYKGFKVVYLPRIKKYSRNKTDKFHVFRKQRLNYSLDNYKNYDDFKKTKDYYCCYVCGSDMIWSSDRSKDVSVYFLNFAIEDKRISYAPSFGSNKISEENEQIYTEYLKKMRFISCREKSGVDLIKKLTNRDAKLVIDPTLLVSKKKWIEIFSIDSYKSQAPYVLCYLFEGMTKDLKSNVEFIKQKLNLEVRFIPMSANDFIADSKSSSRGVGPVEFVQLFKNAEFVLTNSYHGLIFSLIFNIPFYVIKRNKKGHWAQFEDRLESLLVKLNFSDRLIESTKTLKENELSMDFKDANDLLEDMRQYSLNYLETSIKNVESLQDEK
jgi:hypothetical protein